MLNFIRNIVFYSTIKLPFHSLLYLFCRFLNLLLQFYFFKNVIDIFMSDVSGKYFILILVFFIVITNYVSRLMALKIQENFILYLTLDKLKGRKGTGWISPIVVELWNVIDSFILLLMASIVAIVITQYIAPFILIIISIFLWHILSGSYIKKWKTNTLEKSKIELLFWRLGQQNILESVVFGGVLILICTFLFSITINNLNIEHLALFFVFLRIITSTISRQISTLPRISRYFAQLPHWPIFWMKGLWIK